MNLECINSSKARFQKTRIKRIVSSQGNRYDKQEPFLSGIAVNSSVSGIIKRPQCRIGSHSEPIVL